MPVVTVSIEWPTEFLGDGGTAYVLVQDVSQQDAGAVTVGETDLPADPGAVGEPVRVEVERVDDLADYSVRVHLSRNGSREVEIGDFVTVRSYPVLTRGFGDDTAVTVQRVG